MDDDPERHIRALKKRRRPSKAGTNAPSPRRAAVAAGHVGRCILGRHFVRAGKEQDGTCLTCLPRKQPRVGSRWQATHKWKTHILSGRFAPPGDPSQDDYLNVRPSTLGRAAGLGAFAKRDIPAGTTFQFDGSFAVEPVGGFAVRVAGGLYSPATEPPCPLFHVNSSSKSVGGRKGGPNMRLHGSKWKHGRTAVMEATRRICAGEELFCPYPV